MAKRYLGGGISFEQKDVYQEFSEDEGGGGSTTLGGLTDVDISNPTNGQTLVYNATSGKWENGAGVGSGTLVLHIITEGSEDRLDHTYAEISSAGYAVLSLRADLGSGHYSIRPIPLNTIGHGTPGGGDPIYFVSFIDGQNQFVYTTETENGYPTAVK